MKESTKKILDITGKVISWVLIAFVIFIMIFTIVSVKTVDKNNRKIFGHKFYIVRTDSMSKSDLNKHLDVHFNAGDIVIIKEAEDNTALQPGDIISFISANTDSYGETITHMIREVKKNSSGKVIGYVTYGTNTNTNDKALVEPEYVLGVYKAKLPGVGNFFAFLKTTPGYIVCILVPFLLLIVYNGVNVIVLFRRYKKEQSQAMALERAQINEERLKNEQMLKDLLALKEELALQVKANKDIDNNVDDK